MRKFLFTVAVVFLGTAVGGAAVTHTALVSARRIDQAEAIRRVQAENAAIRLELDAMRRELSLRPVPPAKGPTQADPDLIPATNLPTEPKE